MAFAFKHFKCNNGTVQEYDVSLSKDDMESWQKAQTASYKAVAKLSKIGTGSRGIKEFLYNWNHQ